MIGEGGRELAELMAVARENVALIADAAQTAQFPVGPAQFERGEPVVSTIANAIAAPRAEPAAPLRNAQRIGAAPAAVAP